MCKRAVFGDLEPSTHSNPKTLSGLRWSENIFRSSSLQSSRSLRSQRSTRNATTPTSSKPNLRSYSSKSPNSRSNGAYGTSSLYNTRYDSPRSNQSERSYKSYSGRKSPSSRGTLKQRSTNRKPRTGRSKSAPSAYGNMASVKGHYSPSVYNYSHYRSKSPHSVRSEKSYKGHNSRHAALKSRTTQRPRGKFRKPISPKSANSSRLLASKSNKSMQSKQHPKSKVWAGSRRTKSHNNVPNRRFRSPKRSERPKSSPASYGYHMSDKSHDLSSRSLQTKSGHSRFGSPKSTKYTKLRKTPSPRGRKK